MSRFVYDGVEYRLGWTVGIYIDMRFISFDWIEADTIAILPPRSFVGLPEDELVPDALYIFKF